MLTSSGRLLHNKLLHRQREKKNQAHGSHRECARKAKVKVGKEAIVVGEADLEVDLEEGNDAVDLGA